MKLQFIIGHDIIKLSEICIGSNRQFIKMRP